MFARSIQSQEQQIGNKTECGLLGFVRHLGGSYEDYRKAHPESDAVKVSLWVKKL